MKNIKLDKGLVGKDFWIDIAHVDVAGRRDAKPRVAGDAQEQTIQTWSDIAVLQVTPGTAFKFGFLQDGLFEFLKENIEADHKGRFGVRIGDKDTKFFVLPADLDATLTLELIETTKENDPLYADLPIY